MLLEIQNLSKVYDKNKGLKSTSFRVNGNELVAIVGHNGAGKSTLLKMIGQWCIPDHGRIMINNSDVKAQKLVLNKVCFIPEVPNLYDFFSVDYNLKLFASLFGQPQDRVEVVLEQLQLIAFRKHKVQSLSKGLKQRVSIGRSLISDPQIILLDEPTSGLDFETTKDVYKIMRTLHRNGKTILFTTHQPEEVSDLATRILALHQGQLVFDGTPENYFLSSVRDQIRKALNH